MYQLTKQEYDKVFTFYSTINSDYSNYENIVLLSLSTIFNMRLTAYVVYKADSNGEMKVDRIISNSIRKEILEQYKKEYYINDAFLKNYSQLCYSNASSCYYTDDELEPGVFQSTQYAELLSSHNIAHEAIIGINSSTGCLMHIIKVYKTAEAGNFTDREKELFQYIGQAFNQSKVLYSRFIRQQRRLDAVAAYCDELSLGFAVLDDMLHIIQSNSKFMAYGSMLSSGLTKSEIARDIIFAVTGKTSLPNENYFREEAHLNGIVISLQKKRFVLSYRTENLYLLTMQKDNGTRTPDLGTLDLLSCYGLTRREAEVTQLVIKGYNNQEIADELYIGVTTVKTHISNIFGKLSVRSRTELMQKLRSDEVRRKTVEQ